MAACNSTQYKQAITLTRTAAPSRAAAPPATTPTMQLQAVPNPATGSVQLSGYATQAGPVRLILCDNLGRVVRTVLEQEAPVGPLAARASLVGLATGIYYATLQTANQRVVTRLSVIN